MARDLAIDLGTANTLVYMKGRGIVLNEPSVIALNRQTGEVLATGHEAWQMIGRTPGYIVAVRPLRGGAITDFEITERMIRLLLQRVGVSRFTRPKVVICVPSAITEVERRAVTDAARRAGAADANLIEQPMAAAIGADLPIDEPVGNMVIDIGGGTSETAVISLGGIVALEAVRIGSFDVDAAIQNYVRREHGIAIGERTAEEIKKEIGSADPVGDDRQAEVRGRDLMTGLPKTVILTPEEIRFAIEDVISSIIASVIRCLAKAPPELSQDFLTRGMYLVGGGSLLRGVRERIERETRVPVRQSTAALEAVVLGAGHVIEHYEALKGMFMGRDGDLGGATVTVKAAIDEAIAAGLDAIRAEADVPGEFPPEIVAAAEEAARRQPGSSHADRTAVAFVTLDPASATDLDQAFAIERSGDDLILHYAIADVGFFVDPESELDEEAWRRGGTVYLPDHKSPLYPPPLSEGAASLLPDGPRPAVVFTVRVDPGGDACLDGAERAVIHSRAKLAYEDVDDAALPLGFDELARRVIAAEERRGASRVEFADQVLEHTPGGWRLRFELRLESEDRNAAMSLATNLAVAEALHAAGTGLFRVMADVPDHAVRRLRHTARAFELEWPEVMSLARFQRSLRANDQRSAAFLLAVRRASGGASYQPFTPGEKPWHAAMAAMYAHATAPLRRLADRYVVEAALAVASGSAVADHVQASFAELPKVMARAEERGNRVENAVNNLAEAVLLDGREGEVFDGVIVDEDRDGPLMQIAEPAILGRVRAARVTPGDEIRVRLVEADPVARRVEFHRVG